jgi:multidrug efflux system membrane fusion protein
MKPRYRAAATIAALVALWLGTGLISHGTSAPAPEAAKSGEADMPLVKVRVLTASARNATITVRGRTQALHAVDVRAEVDGVVKAIHFKKGQHVKTGTVLCELKPQDRTATLNEARALVAQRSKEYEVAKKLFEDGFRSKTQMAQAEAALEAARAQQDTRSIALANTKIRAPFDGVIDDRYVDVGDYMRVGDKCALVIAPEPFLAVGAVSEDQVGEVSVGDAASATLVTGQTVNGTIRFVSNKADDATRTFRVEVELPNADDTLRDGVSADIHIPVREVRAQKISPGILVLDDHGVVGVRAVEKGVVRFIPVTVISDGPQGMWVAGLPDRVTVITVGQEFVSDGERVKTVPDKNGFAT